MIVTFSTKRENAMQNYAIDSNQCFVDTLYIQIDYYYKQSQSQSQQQTKQYAQ